MADGLAQNISAICEKISLRPNFLHDITADLYAVLPSQRTQDSKLFVQPGNALPLHRFLEIVQPCSGQG